MNVSYNVLEPLQNYCPDYDIHLVGKYTICDFNKFISFSSRM